MGRHSPRPLGFVLGNALNVNVKPQVAHLTALLVVESLFFSKSPLSLHRVSQLK